MTSAYADLCAGDGATGTLHLVNADGTDGGTVKDADGKDVTASATFTPEASDGTVKVQFTFDASQLDGRTVVAFEDVSRGGVTVATHADVTDEDQSVHFVDLHTTATDMADGDHEIAATTSQAVVDSVEYTNLVPGREYTVTGTLHVVTEDGTDGGTLKEDDGDGVTATTTFTPETADGTVDVVFTLDASQLAGTDLVAFEDLSRAGVTVATHADITDEGQTVTVTTPTTTPTGDYPNTGQTPWAPVAIAAAAAAGTLAFWIARRRDPDDDK